MSYQFYFLLSILRLSFFQPHIPLPDGKKSCPFPAFMGFCTQVSLKGLKREDGANPSRTRRCNRGNYPQESRFGHCSAMEWEGAGKLKIRKPEDLPLHSCLRSEACSGAVRKKTVLWAFSFEKAHFLQPWQILSRRLANENGNLVRRGRWPRRPRISDAPGS